MGEWIKSSLWEIKRYASLQALGAIFAFLHILSFLLWRKNANLFVTGQPDLCWSFFPNCATTASYEVSHIQFLVMSYLIVSTLALVCYLVRRLLGFAWVMMIMAFSLKLIFYFSDAALAENPHVLHFTAEFCFLFIPNKGPIIRALVLSYYLVIGGLKLNSSWLSGMWLGEHLAFPTKVLEWVAAFSALIELVIPLGLFMRYGDRLAIAVLTLLAYHGFYWFVSGFYEPLTMMAFLIFFVIAFFEKRNLEREYMYQSFSRPEPTKLWWPVVFLTFWALQLTPVLFPQYMKTNILQLQAHATPKECFQRTFLVYEDGMNEYEDNFVKNFNETLKCNTFVHFRGVKNLCKKHKSEARFSTIASYFYVRQFSESDFQRVFEISDFCDEQLKYENLGGSQ